MPNGESALTRSAYALSGRRSRPPDFVLSWHAPCVHPWRAITVPWMASHVLAYVSHGQVAGAVDAFARTVLFFVFGLDSCAHQRALPLRSEEHTSELQSRPHLVCRLLLEKKKKNQNNNTNTKTNTNQTNTTP